MIDNLSLVFEDRQLRRCPILNEVTSTYDEVVSYLPVHTTPWRNSRARVLTGKAVMFNWQLNEQWRRWNHASTQLLRFGKESRSLNLSILNYQIDQWSDWQWRGDTPPWIDGEDHFLAEPEVGVDPARLGTFAILWAARLLLYDIVWMADDGHQYVRREIESCINISIRCGYLCSLYYGKRLV